MADTFVFEPPADATRIDLESGVMAEFVEVGAAAGAAGACHGSACVEVADAYGRVTTRY